MNRSLVVLLFYQLNFLLNGSTNSSISGTPETNSGAPPNISMMDRTVGPDRAYTNGSIAMTASPTLEIAASRNQTVATIALEVIRWSMMGSCEARV